MAVITEIEAVDVRFPTSRELDGSDAMNPEPDYAAAYVTLRTSDGQKGYGLAFTVGRGNDVQVAAVEALAPLAVGMRLADMLADLGAFSRRLTGDSQLRWLGPHKGVIHMAAAAIVNAAWDLYARWEGKPGIDIGTDLDVNMGYMFFNANAGTFQFEDYSAQLEEFANGILDDAAAALGQ